MVVAGTRVLPVMSASGPGAVLGERRHLDDTGHRGEADLGDTSLMVQPPFRHHGVSVGVHGPHRGRSSDPPGQRARRPDRPSLPDGPGARLDDDTEPADRSPGDGGRGVGAGVGHDDELEAVVSQSRRGRRPQDRLHALGDVRRFVAGGNDDGEAIQCHLRVHQSTRKPGSRKAPA